MPLECLAELVDDRAQILQRDGAHEVVDAGEDVGDGCGHLGVGLFDAGAVGQVGGAVALGPQVDVLLAHGGEPGDHGLGVGGDAGRGLLDAQFGDDALGGEVDRADAAHRDAPVGDVGVGEQPAGAR